MTPDDRIYNDTSLGKHADEHLEVVYNEVYHWQISDYVAIGVLLDPYAEAIFGDAHVPFRDSLENLHHAVKWATQFGELRIIPITEADLAVIREEPTLNGKIINFGAKIGPDKDGQSRSYGQRLEQAIVLSGVQVLREYSYELLNPSKEKNATH